ncbi:flagellar protein FlaG [Deferribacter autotrophicus]|uniref:Flagellar protein FlaG n=1 Tax=Deferribacter autotrophicus TaxID=500465 RepID=A0A5A8F5R0_9BACT|nr:flagellar protein FlaG [Deferribacter autotrophicus]KAA0258783.1 flagellar protein FlaG [Deferribacter autotrophicus]
MLEAVKNATVSKIDHAPSNNEVKTTQKVVEQNAKQQEAQKRVNEQEFKKQIQDLNKALDMMNVKREFVIDKELNEVVVKIVDPEENKVIRQIPSEEALKLAKNIKEMVGLLFDKTT